MRDEIAEVRFRLSELRRSASSYPACQSSCCASPPWRAGTRAPRARRSGARCIVTCRSRCGRSTAPAHWVPYEMRELEFLIYAARDGPGTKARHALVATSSANFLARCRISSATRERRAGRTPTRPWATQVVEWVNLSFASSTDNRALL